MTQQSTGFSSTAKLNNNQTCYIKAHIFKYQQTHTHTHTLALFKTVLVHDIGFITLFVRVYKITLFCTHSAHKFNGNDNFYTKMPK